MFKAYEIVTNAEPQFVNQIINGDPKLRGVNPFRLQVEDDFDRKGYRQRFNGRSQSYVPNPRTRIVADPSIVLAETTGDFDAVLVGGIRGALTPAQSELFARLEREGRRLLPGLKNDATYLAERLAENDCDVHFYETTERVVDGEFRLVRASTVKM
jgi:hypothetical protein